MDKEDRTASGEGIGAETGMIADFGVAQPGSPADAMGTSVPAPSGGVGAQDAGADSSLTGDDQAHDRGIVDETSVPLGDAIKPRFQEDIDPGRSNVSGPTRMEEGNDR